MFYAFYRRLSAAKKGLRKSPNAVPPNARALISLFNQQLQCRTTLNSNQH